MLCCVLRTRALAWRPTIARAYSIFFVQAGSAEPAASLGIGLALMKRLAELHGGSVSALSEGLGHGAAFTVRLPAVAPPPVHAEAPPIRVDGARSILIVEDNDDARVVRCMPEVEVARGEPGDCPL
jgi:hypothetical protein